MDQQTSFRCLARECLERAREELANGDEGRLRYAALELRMAMEALVYDRVELYKDELAPGDYSTWQPKKLMQVFMDIDPLADKGAAMWAGVEREAGKPAEQVSFIGAEEVLSFATIKRHYDALGSYLHLPTVAQLKNGSAPSLVRLKERLGEVSSALERALSSSIHNARLTVIVEFECLRCGKMLQKRAPDKEDRQVACLNCGAQFLLKSQDDNRVAAHPGKRTISCSKEGCGASMELWNDHVKVGHEWKCGQCGRAYRIGLTIRPMDEAPENLSMNGAAATRQVAEGDFRQIL